MNVLILNWRDSANPKAGGAERVTDVLAAGLIAAGHNVTWFTSSFPGALQEETKNGVRIIRRGGQITVRWHAYRWYRKLGRAAYDIVVDEINTIPFGAPRFVREPVLAYINQLAREVWRFEAPVPLSTAGRLVEPLMLKQYRETPVVTISGSTRDDLVGLGFREKNIRVMPLGLDIKSCPESVLEDKTPEPILLYFGSLRPMKRVDQAILAMPEIIKQVPGAVLRIAGGGREKDKKRLEALVRKLGLTEKVTFPGRVNDEEKARLMAGARLLLVCSAREGWGLVVIEANACGTPAVVYDVPGLRDSVVNGETGLIAKENTPLALAAAAASLLLDEQLYKKISRNAWLRSKTFNWEETERIFIAALNDAAARGRA